MKPKRREGEKFAWKVLKRWPAWDGSFFSYLQSEGEGGLVYPLHRTISPRKECGPFAGFNTLCAAKTFVSRFSRFGRINTFIAPCYYRPSRASKMWYWEKGSWIDRGQRSFWEEEFPQGTVLARQLRIIAQPRQVTDSLRESDFGEIDR